MSSLTADHLACMAAEKEIRDAIMRLNESLAPRWEVIEVNFDPRKDHLIDIVIDER